MMRVIRKDVVYLFKRILLRNILFLVFSILGVIIIILINIFLNNMHWNESVEIIITSYRWSQWITSTEIRERGMIMQPSSYII